jgi:hypothetical protein
MEIRIFLLITALLTFSNIFSQEKQLDRLENLIGKWEGTGEGFSSSKSIIESEFNWIMNKQFIEVRNRSVFEPTSQNPEGEIHEDWGILSFDNARKKVVFRQFHIEGFYNEYLLSDSLSDDKTLIFETERIENFVPGGRARFTIHIISANSVETLFDVGFPGKEMACYGRNQLKRK